MNVSNLVGLAGITNAMRGSTSSQGSQNSSWSNNYSNSATYGTNASAQAVANMNEANRFTEYMWDKAAAYNAEQANIERAWMEAMSNTTYQRTVQDMIAAGINPILAAGAGLGADTVGSAGMASMGGASGSMAAAYPDSISSSAGSSQSNGESWGSSESGLATGLGLIADAIKGMLGTLTGSHTVNVAIQGLKDFQDTVTNDTNDDGETKTDEVIGNTLGWILGKNPMDILDTFTTQSSKRYDALKKSKNTPSSMMKGGGTSQRINESNWGYKK